MTTPDLAHFRRFAKDHNLIPLLRRVMSDQLTPVLAYRRLVAPDERTAPSFLLESVESGANVGRYSYLAAQPAVEVVARENAVTVIDHAREDSRTTTEADPLAVPQRLARPWRAAPAVAPGRGPGPRFVGGWVGYAGYDTVRYLEPEKLPFDAAPADDRSLPDLHLGLYRQVAVFDHVEKVLYAVCHVLLDEHASVERAFAAGGEQLDGFVERLMTHTKPLPAGSIDLDLHDLPAQPLAGNFTRRDFEAAAERCKAYIAAGDAFQIVLSQRFERQTTADPFEIYRSLRIVNPSPYMIYLQGTGSILVGASPEILCRVEDGVVTNRPLAGTRSRGATCAEDRSLERDLRTDAKERAEHVMLVDLGRNDLGRVCSSGSIRLERVMEVERYSHVMHLSSTVTGRLREGLDAWDALRATLPVGTVSGAPKVRAMQIIDALEPTRRGPYAGGIGVVGFTGDMDIALALRTLVVPTASRRGDTWTVHLQAGAGIVADSVPGREYEETVNKSAALGRAIDLAEGTEGLRADR
ncbi:MAG: anthranilate synthase component I [Planctomycetota bacterium]|jgi:anthranilate synthase component 1